MDRRQRKTRRAIFLALTELLAKKDFSRITVEEIIARADVGRTTFYTHFETKEHLLKELCDDLFCHIFDCAHDNTEAHLHLFECEAPDFVFLHLFSHLKQNDNHILELLCCPNCNVFLTHFKEGLLRLVYDQKDLFEHRRSAELPEDFWANHVASVFTETVHWWVLHGCSQSPETISRYFMAAV